MGKDYTGMKFNNLTFIRKSKRTNNRGRTLWELECDCANHTRIFRLAYPVTSGRLKSCGCITNIVDRTGEVYGRLTFIRPTTKRRKGHGEIIWELKCECDTIIYRIAHMVTNGNCQSCGCLKKDTLPFLTRKYDAALSSAHVVHKRTYKDCPFDIFMELSQSNCHYCGVLPSKIFNAAQLPSANYNSDYQKQQGNFTYNGLDRIDNKKGHETENVVSCCFTCNRMKSDMAYDEFKAHIKQIYEHIFSTNNTQLPKMQGGIVEGSQLNTPQTSQSCSTSTQVICGIAQPKDEHIIPPGRCSKPKE